MLQETLGQIDPRLAVFIASLLPVVEPRYAVAIGVGLGLPLWEAIAVSMAGVAVLSIVLTTIIGFIDSLAAALASREGPLARLARLYFRLRDRAASKARGAVDKWGLVGLAAFVAAPLPATGMYTGALAALVLGVRGPRLALALALGGATSVILVAAGYAGARW